MMEQSAGSSVSGWRAPLWAAGGGPGEGGESRRMFERSELRRLPPEPDQPSPVAAHCALGLLVLFGPRHRPLGASHSEEKESAKKKS